MLWHRCAMSVLSLDSGGTADIAKSTLGTDGNPPVRVSISCQTNVDLSVDIAPFLGVAKCPNQLLKCFRMLGSVFKPCQKIKRLAYIATMIELSCDRRQIPYSFGDVMGFVLKNVSTLLLCQIPPSRRFSDRNKSRPRRL